MFSLSRIQELFNQIPRDQFDRLVRQHKAQLYCKRFGAWDHLSAMLYGQFAGANSLRQLEAGFNAQAAHHYHLGTGEVHRTTLADANAKRKPELFADVARLLMSGVESQAAQRGDTAAVPAGLQHDHLQRAGLR